MSLLKRVVTSLAIGISAALSSGTAYSSDLLRSYQLAQENDRAFSAARNTFEAVKQTQRQAKGQYYPSLSVALEHIETEQEINRSDNEVFGQGVSDFPTDDLTLSLSQPIFRWDFVSDRKVAKAEVREAEFQFIAAEQELMLRTAEAYLLTLAAKDNEFVTRSELEAVEQQLKLAEKRLDVGLASPSEVHESRARFQLNQAEVIEAENDIADRNEGLRAITGEAPDQLMPLLPEFDMVPPEPADSEQWIAQAMANNLTVKSREAAVEVAVAEHKRQKADRYPTLDLVARFNNRDTGGSLFGGGSDVDTDDIVLRADWTVFQGGVLRARIREALYKKQKAEDDLELERSTARREARNAYLGVVSSIAKAEALKASLDAQEMTVEAKQKGFETGTASNIEVLDAKRDFFFVQRDYLKARYDYLLSMLNLKRQVGSLSPADLEVINSVLSTSSVNTVSELEIARNVSLPESVTAAATGAPAQDVDLDADSAQKIEADNAASLVSDTPLEAEVVVSELNQYETRQIIGHDWLFGLDTSDYANQLASFSSEDQAIRFIDNANLVDGHYFRSVKSGQSLFYVLEGPFENLEQARQAAAAVGVDDALARKVSALQAGRCEFAINQVSNVADALQTLCQQQGFVTGEEDKADHTAMQSSSSHHDA